MPAAGNRELVVKPCRANGPVRIAVGRWSATGERRVPVTAPRPPVDDLVAVASVVGVLVDRSAA
ncbi:hypothetical protein ACIOJE_34910 [Kitasatospora sp. NPDC087861]|uniref:hypothetical protein n=1 Tax=Kitasatospora sp. NPDC087861 TaxID=3364070 RepID=UPI003801AA92